MHVVLRPRSLGRHQLSMLLTENSEWRRAVPTRCRHRWGSSNTPLRVGVQIPRTIPSQDLTKDRVQGSPAINAYLRPIASIHRA